MTAVERVPRPTTSAHRGTSALRRLSSLIAAAATLLGVVTFSTPSVAGASGITAEKNEAARLYDQIQQMNGQVQYLGEKYDLAHLQLQRITNEIVNTKSILRTIEQHEQSSNKQLVSDAVFAFVTNGQSNDSNPLFSNAASFGAKSVYSQLAEGNINATIAGLKNDKLELTQERSILSHEVAAARRQAGNAAAAFHRAAGLQDALRTTLNDVKGRIAGYYAAIAAAAAAKAAATVRHAHPTAGVVAPPPDSRANIAIRAAESYLGTWYCWGGASRRCVDCSGLIMLAYDAAGIYFPHYSGAMYEETERVPLYDIEPGDLLFYGYDGDEHVAMYVGHGDMIEAEMTGTQVHITPIRLGYGFAGLGRPRA
jgi:cell wall-associated NlpC family hydrolase